MKSIILIIPNFLDNTSQIRKIDFLLKRHIGSSGWNNNIIYHIAYLHCQLIWFVHIRCVVGVWLSRLPPLLPLFVPFYLMLHLLNIYYYLLTHISILWTSKLKFKWEIMSSHKNIASDRVPSAKFTKAKIFSMANKSPSKKWIVNS